MGLTRWVCACRNRDSALQSAFQKEAWFEMGCGKVKQFTHFGRCRSFGGSLVSGESPCISQQRIFGNPTHPFSPLLPCFPSSREHTQDSFYAIPELAPLLRYVIALPARRSRTGGIIIHVCHMRERIARRRYRDEHRIEGFSCKGWEITMNYGARCAIILFLRGRVMTGMTMMLGLTTNRGTTGPTAL